MPLSPQEKDELELLELEEKEHQHQSAKTTNKPGLLETIARHGTQGLTYGFADEAAGGLGALGEVASGMSPSSKLGELYAEYRNAHRARDKEAAAASPMTAKVAELAGGIFAPGGVAGRTATAGAKIGRAIGTGALQGVGSSEDETPGDLAKEAAKGGAGGLLGLGVGAAVSKAIPNAVATGNLAAREAIKHLRPTPTVAQSLGKKGLNEIGHTVNDLGGVRFGSRVGDTVDRLETLRKGVGDAQEQLLEKSGVTVNPLDVASKVRKDVIEPLSSRSSSGAKIAGEIENKTDDFLSHHGFTQNAGPNPKDIPIRTLENEKTDLQGLINYVADPKAKSTAEKGLARAFRTSTEDALQKANPKTAESFNTLKKQYGNLKSAQKMGSRTAGLTSGGTGLTGNLLDMGVGLEAFREAKDGSPEGLTRAGLLGLARAATKGRYHSSVAATTSAISRALAKRGKTNEAFKLLEEAVQRGAPAVGRQNMPYDKE